MSFIILRHIDKITGKNTWKLLVCVLNVRTMDTFSFIIHICNFPKISAVNTQFLNVKQGNMSFLKKEKQKCQGSYVSEEQSDEVTSDHMKAHVHEHSYIH